MYKLFAEVIKKILEERIIKPSPILDVTRELSFDSKTITFTISI